MKPEIRFMGFSDECVEKRLGDVLKVPEKVEAIVTTNSQLLTVKLHGGGVHEMPSNKLLKLGSTKYYVRKAGQLIYGKQNFFNGSMAIIPLELDGKASSGDVPSFDIVNADSIYLYQKISQPEFYKRTEDWASGTGSKRLHEKTIQQFKIQLPTLPEQQKIGALFSKYNAIIALREQKLEELNALKKGMLQQMFDDGHKPHVRFNGFNDEWVEKKLGDVASFSRGNGYTKNDLVESGSPIILYGRLYTKYETIIKNVDTFVKKKANSIISEGFEVIVPASGESSKDISRASAVAMSGLILGGDLNVIKPLNYIDSVFLALTISNGSQQRELSKRAQGKSIVHLHSADLKQVDFSYPSFPEQQKIGQLFEKLDARISNEQTKIEQLKAQKQGLLQRML